MNILSKLILWAIMSCFLAFGARAQTVTRHPIPGNEQADIQATEALLCGTADQAKLFVSQHPDNLKAAIATVNDDHNDSTCLSAGIAFVAGQEIGRVQHKDGMYAVTEITIVGVATPYGMLAIAPNIAYTIIKVKDVAA